MRDVKWASQTTPFGWHMRGIWPEDADGTDINACCRSNIGERELLATADDFGKVKLFNYPCVVDDAPFAVHPGHSAQVTSVRFMHGDTHVVSVGGNDRSVLQWRVRRARGRYNR